MVAYPIYTAGIPDLEAPARPSEICEVPIPAELGGVVMKCMEKEPDDRFQSIAELEDALQAAPDPTPWTRVLAAKWWDLHMTDDEVVRDCFCPPMDEMAFDSGKYSVLAEAGGWKQSGRSETPKRGRATRILPGIRPRRTANRPSRAKPAASW